MSSLLLLDMLIISAYFTLCKNIDMSNKIAATVKVLRNPT